MTRAESIAERLREAQEAEIAAQKAWKDARIASALAWQTPNAHLVASRAAWRGYCELDKRSRHYCESKVLAAEANGGIKKARRDLLAEKDKHSANYRRDNPAAKKYSELTIEKSDAANNARRRVRNWAKKLKDEVLEAKKRGLLAPEKRDEFLRLAKKAGLQVVYKTRIGEVNAAVDATLGK